jgi:hypothetical protein
MTFNYRNEIKRTLVLIKTIFFYKCFFYKKKSDDPMGTSLQNIFSLQTTRLNRS